MWLWLILIGLVTSCKGFDFTTTTTDPAQILLRDLDLNTLDELLDERLERLQLDVFRIYEEELKNHEETMKNLERYKRGAYQPTDLPTLDADFWHSYTYDTDVGNREVVKVDSVDLVGQLSSIQIVQTFPINLSNLHVIYKGIDGFGYIARESTLDRLLIHNEWTASVTGCACGASGSECACCNPGSCLCSPALGYDGRSCVPCGSEVVSCPSAGPRPLELDGAVGFEYLAPPGELQVIVITVKATVLSLFTFDGYSLQSITALTGLDSLSPAQPVLQLGYVETFVEFYGTFKRRRFLVTFTAGHTIHHFYELMVDPSSHAIAIGLSEAWTALGSGMKVSQVGGHILITVHDENELYIFELRENKWHEFQITPIQKLSLDIQIISWSIFSSGFENYIVIVTVETFTLYIQKGFTFEILQTVILSHGLTAFSGVIPIILPSCRNEIILVAGDDNVIVIYAFSFALGAPQLSVIFSANLDIDSGDWTLAFGYEYKNFGARVILPRVFGTVSLRVVTRLEELPDPVELENQNLALVIEDLQAEISRQWNITAEVEERLDRGLNFNNVFTGDITIEGSVTITQRLTTSLLTLENLIIPGTIHAGGTNLDDYLELLARINDATARLDTLLGDLNFIESSLDDAVLSNSTGRTIGGLKTINNAGLTLSTLMADAATVRILLDRIGAPVDIQSIFGGLVRVGHEGAVSGTKTITGELIVGELHTDFLDDVPVSDIVTTTGDQAIEGALYLSVLVAQDIQIVPGGTVGGVDISEAVLLTEEVNLGQVVFTQGLNVEVNVVLSGQLNGQNLQRLFERTLQLTGGELSGGLIFVNDLSILSLDAPVIMGINVAQFMETTVFTNRPAVLLGHLTITQSVVIESNLVVEGTVNNQRFPEDFLLKGNGASIVFTGHKSFGNIQFGQVTFGPGATIDGISLDRLVTRTTNQVITGQKTFSQGIDVQGNLDILTNIIDGVDLNNLADLIGQVPSTLNFDVIFEGPVQVPSLLFDGTVNGLDLNALAADIIYGDGDAVIISVNKRFNVGLTVSIVQIIGTFNGENLSNLVTTHGSVVINGRKTFIGNIGFENLDVELIDGVNICDLANNSLIIDRLGQVVTGRKTFTNGLVVGSLDIQGRVNNLDFSNVVTKSGHQTFTAAQTLYIASFADVDAQLINLAPSFTVNGIDLSFLAENRVALSDAVDHIATLSVDGPVTVVGTLYAEFINGYDIEELRKNIVIDEGSCVIEGPVTIRNLVVEGLLTTEGAAGANGLSIRDIASNAVLLGGDNVWTGSVVFSNLELRGDVDVGGLVDGVKLSQLRNDAVYTDVNTLQVITGTKTFRNGFHVKGDINTITTNGVDLSTQLFTLHTDQEITGPYYFTDIEANSHVYLFGFFNDIDLRRLNTSTFVRGSQNIPTSGNVIFTGDVTVKNFNLTGYLDDININDRFGDAIKLQTHNYIVTGRKTFLSSVLFLNLDVENLNGVDLQRFFDNLVFKNTQESLLQTITVHGTVSARQITVRDLTVHGTIDGVDYRELLGNVVYLSGTQNIQTSLIFTESIVVNGNIVAVFLNGGNLEQDYLTTITEQVITAATVFSTITTTNVEVDGLVNLWILPNEAANTLLVTGGQVVTGFKIFVSRIKVLGNVEVSGNTGRTISIKLSNEAVLLSGAVEIFGLLRFTSPLTVFSLTSTTEIINNINIRDVYVNAWYIDRQATIVANFVFRSSVTFKVGINTIGLISEETIADIIRQVKSVYALFANKTELLKVEYEGFCSRVITLYEQLEKSIYVVDYLEPVYSHLFPHRRHSSFSFTAFNEIYLIISYEGECYSTTYIWDIQSSSFQFYKELQETGYGHQWLLVETGDAVFVVVAASTTDNECENTHTTVWRITENHIMVEQELAAGESISTEPLKSGVLLHVHTEAATITYEYSLLERRWIQVASWEYYEISVHLVTEDAVISVWISVGYVVLRIDGVMNTRIKIADKVEDAVLVLHGTRVLLFVVVASWKIQHYVYALRVYEIFDGLLYFLDSLTLSTFGKITAFFAGNEVCGSTFIVVTQYNLCPTVYFFQGDQLTVWIELALARITWIQYFGVPTLRFPSILDHYLLLGRDNATAEVMHLVMKGATVPERDNMCDISAFTDPLLLLEGSS